MALADTARLVTSLELQDKFSKTADQFDRRIGRTEQNLSTLERVGYQTGRGLRNTADNLKTIGVIGGGLAVAGIIKSINAASDLNESLSKTTVVFGESADEIVAWSENSAEAFGLSQQAALETASTFGNLFTAMGIGDEVSTDMSQSLVELAADLASFNNLGTDEVLEKLRAGIVGEAEPLRRLGIQISAARTEAKAMELGFEKVDGQLSASAKAQANYAIILEDSQKAQGDFARTSDGLANQQRILRAQIENSAAAIGTSLTPVVAKLAGRLSQLLKDNQPAIDEFARSLPAAFDQLVEIGENIPWGVIGTSLQLAGAGAKTLLGAFTAMPDWVQTAVLTGWGLNKLTGGALGNIAGTLTKALFSGRGGTPATPMFTKEVGPGGVPGAGPGGGVGTFGRALGFAGFIGLLAGAGIGLSQLVREVEPDIIEAKEQILAAGGPNAKTRAPGAATPLGQFDPRNAGGVPVKVTNADEVQEWDERNFNRAAAAERRTEAQLDQLVLEQRLLRDKAFKNNLTPESFLRVLRRTSEFGERGVGTSIEQGPTTGRDPFGKVFLALVNRLSPREQKAPEVLFEIRNHVKAAEEVQRTALREGDVKAARKLQDTINALHRILGTEDKQIPLLRDVARRAQSTTNEVRSTASRSNSILRGIQGDTNATQTNTAIVARKDFSPNVNVTVPVTTNVSISDVIRQASTYNVATSLSSQLRRGFTP